jgi:hypothetical protein
MQIEQINSRRIMIYLLKAVLHKKPTRYNYLEAARPCRIAKSKRLCALGITNIIAYVIKIELAPPPPPLKEHGAMATIVTMLGQIRILILMLAWRQYVQQKGLLAF